MTILLSTQDMHLPIIGALCANKHKTKADVLKNSSPQRLNTSTAIVMPQEKKKRHLGQLSSAFYGRQSQGYLLSPSPNASTGQVCKSSHSLHQMITYKSAEDEEEENLFKWLQIQPTPTIKSGTCILSFEIKLCPSSQLLQTLLRKTTSKELHLMGQA